MIRKGARAPRPKASRVGASTELHRAAELIEPRELSGHNIQVDVLFPNHISPMMHSLPGHGRASQYSHTGHAQPPLHFPPGTNSPYSPIRSAFLSQEVNITKNYFFHRSLVQYVFQSELTVNILLGKITK